VTIHNALPDAIEAALDRMHADPALAKVPRRVVAVGRLSYQKNYPMLLRALVHAPEALLDILGEGEDAADLRALAEQSGVADRVRFLGLMPREQALAHAATAEVFVQVSHFEGHSLALIEAARLGLPLVVSRVPVQVEGITAPDGEICGIAVPIGDDAGLGSTLARLLSDADERAHWAQKARKLGLAASNRAMIDAYERLLAARPGCC
jgi:glycosyltransferase involved in cell wall biosynthesis